MSESVLTGNNVAARIPRGTTRLPIGSTQFTHNINFVGDTFQVTDVDEYRLEVNASVAGVMSDVPFLFEIFNETLGIVVQSTQHVAPGDGSYREICANLYFQVANPAHFWSLRMRTLSTLVGEPLNAINLQAPGYRAEITMFGGAAGGITGLGTVNRLPKFTAPAIIGDSNISDDGTTVTINSDTVVTGDLEVQGTVIVIDTQHVLIEDSYLYQNNGYTTVAAKTGGTAINYLPTALVDTVAAGGFTAGVPAVSNPTVATTGPATFALADLIQISGASNPANNGLFEVLSHAANVLTIRGVGLTATVEAFTQTQFVTNATVAGSIRKIGVSVMRTGTDGIWESGFGNVTPITFNDVASLSAAGTLNRVAKFTAPNTIGDSSITDTGALASCSVPFSVPGAGANSERFGAAATAAGASSLAVGNNAHAPAATSVVIGASAANAAFTGVSNVLIGSSVATALTSGTLNTICGSDAGDLLTIGSSNCLYGNNAETIAVDTANSVGIGHNSVVATRAVAIGSTATAKADSSIVIGYSANGGTAAATKSIVIGAATANATFTGVDNIIIGADAALALTSGSSNCIIGGSTGSGLTTGSNNCLVGFNADPFTAATTGAVGLGTNAYVGTQSVAVGFTAQGRGASQVVIGYTADGGTGTGTIAIGDSAANGTLSGVNNILIGISVASALDTGTLNTICGSDAGDVLTTGSSNCLYGNDAETQAVDTSSSVGIGASSIVATQSVVVGASATANSQDSVVIGYLANAGTNAATGTVVIGASAANATFTGVSNVLIGNLVATALDTGTLNTICGNGAGGLLTTGSTNCLYGYNAETQAVDTLDGVGVGFDSVVATQSVAVGSTVTAFAQNSVVIGYSADGGTDAATSGVVIGAAAANATFTGVSNVLIGFSVATALTSGTLNTICGSDAGDVLTTGSRNCLYGNNTETQAVGTADSVGIGYNVVVATESVSIGSSSTANATTSVIIGYGSFGGTSAATGSTVLGATAGNATATGTDNCIIGRASCVSLTDGYSNCVVGSLTCSNMTTGNQNCLFGYNAEVQAVGTVNSVGIGYGVIVGSNSVAIGATATANASNCVVIGLSADGGTTAATSGVVIGAAAANATFTGVSNVLIGFSVATALTSGTLNTICGSDAGDVLTTGGSNCLYGNDAETQAVGTASSVGIGASSIVATQSVVVGASATANGNLAVVAGYTANGGTSAVTNVVVIGDAAANATFTGIRNVLIGSSVASNLGSGTLNTIVGSDAGDLLTTGSSNSLFGFNCETSANSTANSVGMGTVVLVASNSVALGDGANVSNTSSIGIGSATATTASNQFVAGSSAHPATDVYFGKGVTNATPTLYTINGTGGSGTDIAGGSIVVAGGQSTGTGIGGPVIIKASNPAAGTGSGLNALVEVARFVGNKTNALGASDYSAGFLTLRSVQKNTAATVTVAVDESNRVYTNEGTAANVQFNLPAAAPGLTYTFIQQDSVDLVKIQATGDDTIRDGGVVSAAAGYIKSTAQGDTVTLVAINSTEWIVIYGTGNWTFDS